MSKKISKQSLDKFEERIRRLIADTLSDEDRQELDGAYLSTYECYSTITEDHDNGHRKCNSAIVLMRFLNHGINILGVTSERKTPANSWLPTGWAWKKWFMLENTVILQTKKPQVANSSDRQSLKLAKTCRPLWT